MLAKDGGRDAVGSGEIRGRSGRGGMATVRLEVGGWRRPALAPASGEAVLESLSI